MNESIKDMGFSLVSKVNVGDNNCMGEGMQVAPQGLSFGDMAAISGAAAIGAALGEGALFGIRKLFGGNEEGTVNVNINGESFVPKVKVAEARKDEKKKAAEKEQKAAEKEEKKAKGKDEEKAESAEKDKSEEAKPEEKAGDPGN